MLAAQKASKSRRYLDGRYEVGISWVDDQPPLYSNRAGAEGRLLSLEKQLKRRSDVAEKYCQVMEANVAKGYFRKVEPSEVDDGASWYLPHFPVVREDKQTTKVRIVYDSAARYGGISLNDIMLPGPKLQQDIFGVLTGVRVPRCYRAEGKRVVDSSIHTMVDASQLAYAAVSYVRQEYESGEVTVRIAAAKAKVAPTKATSIPRLELMAAVLGVRLSKEGSRAVTDPI